MQTLILPGYSSTNKEWVDKVANSLKVEGLIRPFYWMHWSDELQKFDPHEKADLIAKHVRGDKINIVAKSLGTLVASLVYQRISSQVEKMIFCGIPLKDLNEIELNTVKNCIGSNRDKIIGFQNINDPHGKFDEVKEFGNIRMTNRDDHNYPFFEDFQNFLSIK